MEAQTIAAIIGAVGAIIAAIIGAHWFGSRKKEPPEAPPSVTANNNQGDVIAAGRDVVYNSPRDRKKAFVEIASVEIIEEDEFPKADIKVSNSGDEVAFLTGIRIEVKKLWRFEPPGVLFNVVLASWSYDIILPMVNLPQRVELPISQKISPNDADRFYVRLGNEAKEGELHQDFVYLISIAVRYNQTEMCEFNNDIVFVSQPPRSVRGAFQSRGGLMFQEKVDQTMNNIREIQSVKAIKSSEVKNLIRSIYSKND